MTGRDTFETFCKENWQDAVSRWILKLKNKKQKVEHRLGELSTLSKNTCSVARGANFLPKAREYSYVLTGFVDRTVSVVMTQLCPLEHISSLE